MTLEKHKNHVQINITFKHILEEKFFFQRFFNFCQFKAQHFGSHFGHSTSTDFLSFRQFV